MVRHHGYCERARLIAGAPHGRDGDDGDEEEEDPHGYSGHGSGLRQRHRSHDDDDPAVPFLACGPGLACVFTALLLMTALLIVMSVALHAPLLELANSNATPNPSKAPWYFLGLQELLSYYDPQIAGVIIPGIVGLLGIMAVPYVDRNPSTKPADRKFAIMFFTFFLMGSAVLTVIGTLFRGPGFNWTYPWSDGIWFDDQELAQVLEWITSGGQDEPARRPADPGPPERGTSDSVTGREPRETSSERRVPKVMKSSREVDRFDTLMSDIMDAALSRFPDND